MTLFPTAKGDVEIEWTGDEAVVWTTTMPRQEIGRMSFRRIEDEDGDYYKLTHMHLEGPNRTRAFLRLGIGRKCLQLVKEEEGVPILVSPNDGVQRSDGSHLTEHGPAFATRMVDEGLMHWDE